MTEAAVWVDPITVVRSYVYTYVSEYGEEGPPSKPTNATGNVGQDWTITLGVPSAAEAANRSLTKKRIYRTVTSSRGVATYYFVAEVGIAVTTFTDNYEDDDITGNGELESTGWAPPPTDLKGMISLPNGIIAGWRDNEVWFSEPYRPHAWPAEYQVSVDYPVVGLGVMGQTLVICTTGSPWTATGVHPSTMSLAKINSFEPCLSRGSILSTPQGVFYASPNGLVVVQPGSVNVLTQTLITPAKWQSLNNLSELRAFAFNTAYMAYEAGTTGSSKGLMIEPSPPQSRIGYVTLADSAAGMTNALIDPWSTTPILIRGGALYALDQPDKTNFQPYLWRSKTFKARKLENLGAMKVYFEVPTGAPTLTTEVLSPTTLTATMYGIVRLYSFGLDPTTGQWVKTLRFSRELRRSGTEFRLPSGYKAEEFQIEIEARVRVTDIQAASTSKELASV